MSDITVLRVGVYNNFNFTEAELAEVSKFQEQGYLPFVNSNSLVNIRADYPSIITINPYLTSWEPPTGDISNVKACRVKWVAGAVDSVHKAQLDALSWCLSNSVPVLLTYMRFASKASMGRFVTASSQDLYKFSHSYYRLPINLCEEIHEDIKNKAVAGNFDPGLIHSCDLHGLGCPSCGNCALLTYGDATATVAALTLSCSGDKGECLFHCPDCWARKLAKITNFKLDTVTINNKQKGKINHE